MKIKEMIWQHRRDFSALYECEHCGESREDHGYDDQYFHEKVIPGMLCKSCGRSAPDTYQPQATKYPDGDHI